MAGKYLGKAFDIHGGGVDLRFPHHENEQAQSRAAGHPFASYWMHNAWITTSGEKMSKSLGNSLLVPVVLERVRAIELRFYMVAAHYRSHVEFSYEALDEAAQGFRRIEGFLDARLRGAGRRASSAASSCNGVRRRDGRRPRHPRRDGGHLRHGARGQQAAGGRAVGRTHGGGDRRTRDARRPRAGPRRPGLGQRVHGDHRQAHQRRSTSWWPGFSNSARRRGRPRTSPPPTRSATGSRLPASRSKTPPPDRSGPSIQEATDMAGNSQRKGSIKKTGKGNPTAGSGGRVKRGLEGRGPTPKAKDRPVPQGLQGTNEDRAGQCRAPQAQGHRRRRRVGRGAELRRRGASGQDAGDRCVRRRGCRARRPTAGGVQAVRRRGPGADGGAPRRSWTG